jgi:hypothetical protein
MHLYYLFPKIKFIVIVEEKDERLAIGLFLFVCIHFFGRRNLVSQIPMGKSTVEVYWQGNSQ